jgi:intracellular septation protein A
MVQPRGAPVASGELSEPPEPTWRFLLGRGLPQFAAEAVVPVLVFYAAWRWAGLGAGIAASTVASLAIAVWLVRRRRDVGVVAIGVVFVVIQAGVALAAHSTTVYLAQPVVLSALWAVAYAASVVVGRPLIGVFAAAWYPFPAEFRAGRAFKREFGLQSLVWAAFCLARATVRLYVLLHSGVGGFLIASILTGLPPYGALVAWGAWHAKRSFRDAVEPSGGVELQLGPPLALQPYRRS